MRGARSPSLALGWVPREVPLSPEGLVAPRAVVGRLAARLAQADDAALAELRGVETAEGWVILGPTEALPWVEGLTYLGHEPLAPSLWVPTYLALSPHAALVERALDEHLGAGPRALYVAAAEAPVRVVPLRGARALDRARLLGSARALAGIEGASS